VNGPKIVKPVGALTQDQVDIVDMIKELLALALEGQVTTIGIVGCKADGFFSAMRGRQAADLNLACDDLKADILAEVKKSAAERASRRSNILRN
jgi:hypothetical protein